jgi:hypothetical protein
MEARIMSITIMDNVHYPAFYLKKYVTETEFFFHPTQLDPLDRASISPRTSNSSSIVYKTSKTQTNNNDGVCSIY